MFACFPNYFAGLVTDKFEEKFNYKWTAPSFNGIGSEQSRMDLLELEELPSSGSTFATLIAVSGSRSSCRSDC